MEARKVQAEPIPEGHPTRAEAPMGWLVAIAATLGMSVSYIDRQTLAAIGPSVREALKIDHTHFGWFVSAFSMAYLVGAPAAGILVDRLGARRGFAIAVVVWSLVAGLHALATSFTMLFVLRILLGTAEAPSFPAAAQSIRRALPGASKTIGYGLVFTGSSLGAILAAKLAIGLDTHFGFRFAFLGTALIGTAWIPFWLIATRGTELSRADAPRAEPKKVSAFRGDLPPTPEAEARPESWLRFVTRAPILRALVAVIGSAPVLMFVLNWTSQYLVEHWHLPKNAISNELIVPPLLFDLGAIGFGVLASRRENAPRRTHRDLMLVSMLLASTLAFAPLAPSVPIAMMIFGASAAGGGGLYVLVTADMLGRVPVSKTSSAGGMTAAAQSLSHIVVSPLAGWAIDRTHGYTAVLIALGVAVIPASLAFILWPVNDE
jgi:MFS transporter, ACS family, hexuronate transporter